jgi:hypothetical protein
VTNCSNYWHFKGFSFKTQNEDFHGPLVYKKGEGGRKPTTMNSRELKLFY